MANILPSRWATEPKKKLFQTERFDDWPWSYALGSIRNENESQRRNVSNARLNGIHLAQNNKRAKHIAINCHSVLLSCDADVILLFVMRGHSRGEQKKKRSKNEIHALRSEYFPFVFIHFTQFYSWLNGISLNRKAWINVQAHGKCLWFISGDVRNPHSEPKIRFSIFDRTPIEMNACCRLHRFHRFKFRLFFWPFSFFLALEFDVIFRFEIIHCINSFHPLSSWPFSSHSLHCCVIAERIWVLNEMRTSGPNGEEWKGIPD